MQKGWTSVTIRSETKARLVALQRRLLAAHVEGRPTAVELTDRHGNQPGEGLSLDQVVSLLLDREEAHQERKRRSARKRRQRYGRPAAGGDGGQLADDDGAGGDQLALPVWDDTPRFYCGTCFSGIPAVVVAREPGSTYPLSPRYDLRNHSPDGFQWGYCGSGPAQLALAILADATDDETALRLYQLFKVQRVAAIPQQSRWQLSRADVIAWVMGNPQGQEGGDR